MFKSINTFVLFILDAPPPPPLTPHPIPEVIWLAYCWFQSLGRRLRGCASWIWTWQNQIYHLMEPFSASSDSSKNIWTSFSRIQPPLPSIWENIKHQYHRNLVRSLRVCDGLDPLKAIGLSWIETGDSHPAKLWTRSECSVPSGTPDWDLLGFFFSDQTE